MQKAALHLLGLIAAHEWTLVMVALKHCEWVQSTLGLNYWRRTQESARTCSAHEPTVAGRDCGSKASRELTVTPFAALSDMAFLMAAPVRRLSLSVR